jgi:DNA-binding NarL/FixJ family response regulator
VKRVVVRASDPITGAGLSSYFVAHPRLALVPANREHTADVAVLAPDTADLESISALLTLGGTSAVPAVLVTGAMTGVDPRALAECGIAAVFARDNLTGAQLVDAVLAVVDGRAVPGADPLALLPGTASGEGPATASRLDVLSPREIDVLRLIAEGLDTEEIAARLNYSERTVKNVLSAVFTRLNLRNRAHAVAYAVRAGLI